MSLQAILNFQRVSPNLLTGGMPTIPQLHSAAQAGVKTVINLALPTSDNAIPNEDEIVRGLGMEYIHIPVIWEAPTPENLHAVMDALDSHRDQPTLIHCALNYRVSCFVALYRALRLGMDVESAFAFQRQIWNLDEYPIWKAFVAQSLEEK
jgi:uncharacterized protein (TIGR01244 family)